MTKIFNSKNAHADSTATAKCNYVCKGTKKVCTGALNPSFFLGLALILYCICFYLLVGIAVKTASFRYVLSVEFVGVLYESFLS